MRHGLLDLRIVPALALGLIVSFSLFLLMHSLISHNPNPGTNAQQINLVNFVQVQHSPSVQTKNYNHPKPPPPLKQPPPREKIRTNTHIARHVQQLPVNVKFNRNSLGNTGNIYINPNATGNRGSYAPLTPLVKIPPVYPPLAEIQGVQGFVRTCFMVEPDGSVSSPHVTHASSPQARRMLAQSALQTILQWKFFPKKVDGKPVAARACQSIQFKMPKNGG